MSSLRALNILANSYLIHVHQVSTISMNYVFISSLYVSLVYSFAIVQKEKTEASISEQRLTERGTSGGGLLGGVLKPLTGALEAIESRLQCRNPRQKSKLTSAQYRLSSLQARPRYLTKAILTRIPRKMACEVCVQ